jgi:hypothetical protein
MRHDSQRGQASTAQCAEPVLNSVTTTSTGHENTMVTVRDDRQLHLGQEPTWLVSVNSCASEECAEPVLNSRQISIGDAEGESRVSRRYWRRGGRQILRDNQRGRRFLFV